MTIHYAKEYNETPENNRLVRKFKTGDYDAIYQMAMEMKSLINASMVLIPVPNRFGYPDATKTLCNVLKAYTGCSVMDILSGKERQSVYEAKKQLKSLNSEDFGFFINGNIPENAYLVDNVISTGSTIKYILRLIPNANIIVHSIDITRIADLGDNLKGIQSISIEKAK